MSSIEFQFFVLQHSKNSLKMEKVPKTYFHFPLFYEGLILQHAYCPEREREREREPHL